MMASLLYYKKFSKSLEDERYDFNPYEPCVTNNIINDSQMTVCFYVYDCKLSHKSPNIVNKTITCIMQEYEIIFEDGSR